MIDVDGQFPELLRRTEAVVRGVFPLTTRKYVLTASGWRWSNRGDAVRDDLTAQRKAKLHETTITARLVADLELTLPTGKVVDRAPDSVVLRVPHVTARSSFIVDGKELQVVNQLRLRPGLYTRFTIDDNVETFVNTSAAGTYRVLLDRSSGKFQFRVGAGQHFTLYAVLRACGVSDARMREAWGPAVFDASANPVAYPAELHKLFHALRPYAPPPPSDAEAERLVAAFLDSKPLDPDVNRITLGTGFRSITGDALLAAAQKCLQLSRGKTKADDPESLAFKSLHSVEDFVPERLTDALPGIKHAIATRLDRDAKIKLAVHPGVFSAPVLSFFTTSEFARHSDQSNPVDMTSTNFLTTTMGEGGIGSTHAVTDAVRLVHPSHIGLLDPIHTPEGQRIGITGHLTLGAQKQDGKLALDVVDAQTGRTVRKTVQELDQETIAFPGQYDLTAKPPKPLAAQIKGRRQAELTTFRPAEVRYILRDAKNLFGVTTNMVPFMANDDGNRVGMADRHIEQAISLKNPDRPLVQAEFHRGQGYEDAFGAAFLPQSPVAGTVHAVTPDYVEIATGRGKPQRVPLHNRFPLNSSGWLHDTPIVKPGDQVTVGQRLAENNFTRDGALAMGKNLKIAYMPFQGRNFEDGVVVSEAAAHKLTSVHKHEERLDRDRTIKHGLALLLAHFPDQAALIGDRSRYDAAGLIRVGAQINHGDVLIPAVRQQRLREDYDYAKLHKALANTWTDCSVYWTHDHPGKVTDVVVTPSFIKVLVETEEPAVIGDKLCFAPEHDLLTRTGWKPAADVGIDDEVCTLNPMTQEIEYQAPTRVYRYEVVDEPMYDLRSQQVSMLVTLNHRLYVNRRGRVGYELRAAGSVMGTRVRFKKDGLWRGTTPSLFLGFPTTPLMRLLGFFLAEGNREKVDYRIVFHQIKPAGRTWFRNLCAVLGLHYIEQDTRFIVYHKALWTWFGETGGKSWQKRIPDVVLSFGSDALGALWEGVMIGDGSRTNSGSELITTTSPVMRDQLQEVALKCGWSANWQEADADHQIDTPYGRIAATGQIVMKRHRVFTVRLVKAKNRPQLNHGHTKRQNGQAEVITKYTGSVHCVEVPNHVVYTRRDGKPHWSGNSMRHGGKGIITTILPDNEMYRDASGAPIDVLFNPTGIPGRVNPGQMFEAATGKLARQTGKPYIVKNFDDTDTLQTVRAALRKAGMDEHGEETVTDPTTGRTYPRTMVGDTHFLKLKHQVEKKFSARGVGGAYTLNDQPAKMDEESAQRIGGLELYSLLSGDATQFVDDAFQIKGQRNDEYWRALQLGLPLPKPAAPLVADKFNAFLLGAGINLNRHGDKLKALPMTDAQTRAMSNGVIRQPTAVTATDLKPERGGLFDPAVTGGVGGAHWAHIELPEPIVNPLMRKPVRALLGLTETELDGLVSGAYGLGSDGKPVPNTAGDLPCGGEAVASLLSKLDVERELTKTLAAAKATRSAPKLDQLNKRRRYLQALKTAKLTPVAAYMNRLVPIIPPKFRPIYPLPDGSLNVSDPVHGYREVLLTANALRDMQTMKVAPRHLVQLRTDMSRAVAGLVGTTEPLTREAHFKGFLGQLKGVNNKSGFFQSRVMSRTQDLSGRSTVIPDPKLNLDEVGLPEKMGLTIYKPFLVRRLSMLGYSPLEARELVEKGDPIAVKALHVEAQERPVVMNRAPSLHKFNMMAFKPRIVPGRAIQVNPLIVSGYNMDFDGDTVGMHVPVTEAARREALEKLLPSRNLLSPASLRVVPQPTLEMALGLYLMSLPVGTPRKAASETEVVRAYRDKKADVNTAFLVAGKTVCAGQSLINQVLPAAQRISGPMTKTVMSAAIEAVAKRSPEKAPAVINALKDLGAHYVSEIGFSVSLRDLSIDTKARDRILAVARKQEKKTGFEAASREAVSQISRLVHADKENRFVTLSSGSGALSGKAGSVNRMLATPVAVTDHRGQAIPVQIPKSYAEGHDLGSYWSTLPGARKGMMDKGLSTADTGYLTKLLVQANIDNRIVMADCQTREGVSLKVSDADAVGRYTTTGELLTADRLRRAAAKDPAALVLVRSPIKCAAKGGLCQRCFGLNETGQLYPIGFHIGVLAAQTIGEPSTQLALKQFHTGGSLAGKKSEGFPRVRELFTLPENVKNRAILAQRAGRVTAVRPGKAGGWTVEIDRVEHFVPAELGLRAKLGDQIAAGDQLSQRGALRPQDLLAATGDVDRVRKAVIDELDDNFRSSGVSIRRRIFETALKPMTDRVKVVDAAGSSDVHRGDVVSYNRVVDLNRDRKDKIKIEPTMFGVVKVPHLGEDFIGRMMHERLLDTMRDAPALGLTSNIGPHGHPVARLAFGGARQIGAP